MPVSSEDSDSEDTDLESWLQKLGEQERQNLKKATFSEKRTVRFTPATMDRLDRLAEKHGVSVPALIRGLCSEELSFLEAAEETMDQLYDLTGQLADLRTHSSDGPTLSGDERDPKAQELYRQAQQIYEQYQDERSSR